MEEQLIEMRDGVRLAANLFLPDDLRALGRVPAVLEYLPYRKDDSVYRDWDLFHYIVERGYVGARVDIRGTGRSDGVLPDREYSDVEQDDGEAVIDWLSRQEWCNGNVGMWGISWGGFNSIQMAMREPAPVALKAIVACMATDDLFHDDIHYIDGMMHLDEYAVMVDLLNSMTGAPHFELDEATLSARFDRKPWFLTWLGHQRDGEFWQRGSLRPRYERLRLPSYLIAGYYDGYRDSVPRMLAHAVAPMRALIGPWNHSWPHDAVPGPTIEWRADVVRFFDTYLKGDYNGIEDEPPFTVFIRDWYPPGIDRETIPGTWRSEDGWPIARLQPTTLYPDYDHNLAPDGRREGVHRLAYVPSAGANASMWWGELTPDQRPADAFSLTYDSPPLEESLEILGFPIVELNVAVDAPQAHFLARLCDVAPDGSTTLITGGGLNGAHRDSPSAPSPLEPGKWYALHWELRFTSWVFPADHRIRLSISNATFPMIWPTPSAMTMTLLTGGDAGSRLTLPVVAQEERPAPSLAPATPFVKIGGHAKEGEILPNTWTVVRDEARSVTTVRWEGRDSARYPVGCNELPRTPRIRGGRCRSLSRPSARHSRHRCRDGGWPFVVMAGEPQPRE